MASDYRRQVRSAVCSAAESFSPRLTRSSNRAHSAALGAVRPFTGGVVVVDRRGGVCPVGTTESRFGAGDVVGVESGDVVVCAGC